MLTSKNFYDCVWLCAPASLNQVWMVRSMSVNWSWFGRNRTPLGRLRVWVFTCVNGLSSSFLFLFCFRRNIWPKYRVTRLWRLQSKFMFRCLKVWRAQIKIQFTLWRQTSCWVVASTCLLSSHHLISLRSPPKGKIDKLIHDKYPKIIYSSAGYHYHQSLDSSFFFWFD